MLSRTKNLLSVNAMLSIMFMSTVLLPRSLAAVDCRTACHACRANSQHKQMVEIYCAMCQECKQRRKDQLNNKIEMARARTADIPSENFTMNRMNPDKIESMGLEDNQYINHLPLHARAYVESNEGSNPGRSRVIVEIPEGCPTPAPCSDDEEVIIKISSTTTAAPTTTTTTPKPTCPPIRPCKKKTPPPPSPAPPCMMPVPCCAPMCFPYPGYPPVNPPPGFPSPTTPPPGIPSPLALLAPPSTDKEYMYIYIGLPKNVMSTTGVTNSSNG